MQLDLRALSTEAERLAAEGALARASVLYERLLMLNPASAEARFRLGQLHVLRGRYRQGADHLRKALELNYDTPRSHLALGQALDGLENPDLALIEYEKVPDQSPEKGDALVAAARIHHARAELDTAFATYERAAAHGRRRADALLGCSLVLEARQSFDEALVMLEPAFDERPEQEEIHTVAARLVSALGPAAAGPWLDVFRATVARADAPRVHWSWGMALHRASSALDDEAISELRTAIAVAITRPWDPEVNTGLLFDVCGLIRGRPDEQTLIAAISNGFPPDADVLWRARWASGLCVRGFPAEGADQFLLALKASPDNLPSMLSAAAVLRSVADPASRASFISRVREIIDASGTAEIRAAWAENLLHAGETDEGLADFDTSFALRDSADARLRCVEALLLRRRRKVDVRRHLDRAQQLEPSDAAILRRIAKCFVRLGDSAAAIARYSDAADVDPADASSVAEWAGAIANLPQGAEQSAARERIEQHIDGLTVETAQDELSLGHGRAALGDVVAAVKHYSAAIDRDPTLADAYTAWSETLGKLGTGESTRALLARTLGENSPLKRPVPWPLLAETRAQQTASADQLVSRIEANGDRELLDSIRSCRDQFDDLGLVDARTRFDRIAAELIVDDDDALMNAGLSLSAQLGGEREAISLFERALAKRPNDLQAVNRLATALIELGEYQRAIDHLRKAIAVAGADAPAALADCYSELARAYGEMGAHDDALAADKSAMALASDNYWIRFRFAVTLADVGRHDDAIAEYERAARLDRTTAGGAYAHHNSAWVRTLQGQYANARARWSRCAEVYQAGLAGALDQGDWAYCLYYGRVRGSEFRQFEFAEELFRAAHALNPDHPAPVAALATMYIDRAKETLPAERQESRWAPRRWLRNELPGRVASSREDRTRYYWQATLYHRQAIELFERLPRNSRPLSVLGEVGELHLQMEELDAAEKLFGELIERDPGASRGHRGLGEVFLRQKRHDLAIASLKKALNLFPDDLSGAVLLARAHLQSGEQERAEAICRDVIDAAPCHVDALALLGEVYLAMVERARSEDRAARSDLYDRAIRSFSAALDVWNSDSKPSGPDTKPASVCYLRGYAKVQLFNESGLFKERRLLKGALADFEACLRLDPDHHKARRALDRLKSDSTSLTPRKVVDRIGAVIFLFAVLVFAVAQLALVRRLPARGEFEGLTKESLEAMRVEGVEPAVVDRLERVRDLQFRNSTELLTHVRTALDTLGRRLADSTITQHAVVSPGVDLVRITTAEYIILTFGSLVFMVAGAYLPHLTGLKVPGLQLEKTGGQTSDEVRSIAISR